MGIASLHPSYELADLKAVPVAIRVRVLCDQSRPQAR
jgi:hypothetical protein